MKRPLLLLLLLATPFRAGAQEQDRCGETEPLRDCFTRIYTMARTTAKLERDIQERPTGVDAVDSDIGSAKKDLLNRLSFAVQSATLDSKKQELVVTWNLPKLSSASRPVLQLQSVLRPPQLFGSIKSGLNQAGRTDEVGELEQDLNDLDDVSTVLAISYESSFFGRSFAPNRDDFARRFQRVVNQNRDLDEVARRARDERNRLLQEAARDAPQATDTDSLTLRDISESRREVLNQAFVASARAQAAADRNLVSIFADSDLAGFKNLLDNQPQFLLTISQRHRDSLVGPDLLTAHISYEWNRYSLNSFRSCEADPGCRLTLAEYNKRYPVKRNGRWKFFAEYTWSDEYAARPDLAFPEGLDRATRLTGSVTFGKPLLFDAKGDETARIDFLGKYENFSDDPMRDDRGVASLTYTQKISETLQLPIGLSYANHGEFLGDVDQRFSAHFGLSLRVFNP